MFLRIVPNGAMNVIDPRLQSRPEIRKESMTTFTIDAENKIIFFAALKQIQGSEAGTETFTNLEELTALAVNWPGVRLVDVWNSLPGVQPVERFTSRRAAVGRIWKAIQHLKPSDAAESQPVGSKQGRARKKAARKPRGKDTKTAKIIASLKRPAGASLKSLMRDTGWLSHSVRGFISGQLGKKLGLRVRSFQRDGERVYAIKS
jgi:Protein of unknown function (DUF3489)